MKCLNPQTILKRWSPNEKKMITTMVRKGHPDTEDGYLVNCGQCMACRIRRKREWSLRLAHEAKFHHQSMFLTLTYNPENLPDDLSLDKSHVQLFIKRLRRAIERRYPDRKIKYYAVGEYGEPTQEEKRLKLSKIGRAHYHILIFGWSPCLPDPKNPKLTDMDDLKVHPENHKRKRFEDTYYVSPFLEQLWGKGFCTIGAVSQESAQYVAGYCTKKINGDFQEDNYTRIHSQTGQVCVCLPEFQLQSQGLGKGYVQNYKQDMAKGFITYDTKTYSIPRYYRKMLDKEHQELTERMKRLLEQSQWIPIIYFSYMNTRDELNKLTDLIDKIELSRQEPDSFEILPDFEYLQYQTNVSNLYQERVRQAYADNANKRGSLT